MAETEQEDLEGKHVGILIASSGTEQIEFTEPKQAVEDKGATVEVLSSEPGEAQAVNNDLDAGDTFPVDTTFREATPGDYDALIVPGGTVGADRLRIDDDAVNLVREHLQAGKPLGAICHGPWVLVEAGDLTGRMLTSFPSLKTDIENAGGEWVDKEVVTDDTLVTSRNPDDLPAFCEMITDVFGSGPGSPPDADRDLR